MNNLDFEKTQIWAKNLVQASVAENTNTESPAPLPKSAIPKKPEMKKLSAEEKMILAAGGALAVGLGAIVISSLGDGPIPLAESQKGHIAAPKLNFGDALDNASAPASPSISILSTPPPAPSHAPKPAEHASNAGHSGANHPAAAREEQHALLEIPDIPEVASTVTDDMTFIDAFGKARAEVGPAGLFAWKGTYYSTFTDKEWDGVSDQNQEKWLHGAQPIIEPDESIAGPAIPQEDISNQVVVAERGAITWTGIDKDGDGQTEILLARIHGQAPMVLMDTDHDGILDTRYDYEPASGKTFASEIQPFPMSTSDVENMEEVTLESDMGFFTNTEYRDSKDVVPVSIFEENGRYLVSTDSNLDKTIDTLTFLSDDHGPLVGLDYDNDGQIEMGFVYNSETGTLTALEMDPLEEMNFESTELPDLFPTDHFEITYEPTDDIPDLDDEDGSDPFFDNDPETDDYNVYS